MGGILSTNSITETTEATDTYPPVVNEKILLLGYLRQLCVNNALIPNDIFEIVLLYYHLNVLCIISQNDKLNIIELDKEKNIRYNNPRVYRYRRDVLYQRKLGIIDYNLIPYTLNKSLLEQIEPLQRKNTNFRDNNKFIKSHIENENESNNLKIQDLIDPYNNIHTFKSNEIHWIPTIFEREKDKINNKVWFKIVSEINDLPSKEYGNNLYQTLENIFNEFVPLFNDIMYDPLCIEKKRQFAAANCKNIFENIYSEKRLFVVIKMQDYIFNGKCEYKPNWHKEGYDTECIEAVGIYYFHTTNSKYFQCNELELKCITGLEDKANGCGKYWRKFDNKNIETVENMCIAFKNDPKFSSFSYRYVIEGNENAILHRAHLKVADMDDNKDSVSRKILSFFVIDPVQGYEKWNGDNTKSLFQNVNGEKMSKLMYNRNREKKNNPHNLMYSMKPPDWVEDDPLTRIVYAGMGD